MGIGRPVFLRAARGLESPVAAGIWRPVIFLPASLLTGMPPELLEALLAHELAHIRRHDYLVNLVQSAIEVLLFYHPAVWWISRRIRIEREQICDDLAAGALGEPRRLALALQELDLLQLSTPHLAQGAHGGNLMNRIRRLIHPEPRPLAWKALASILGVTAACAATTALAAPFHREGLIASASPQATEPASPAEPPQPPRPPKPTEPPPPPEPLEVPEAPRAHMNYVFVRPDGRMSCSGSRDSTKEVQELKKSHPGGFLWFRDGGRSYVIDDPAEVARLQELYKPMEELGRKMKDLGREMKAQGARMKAVGAEMKGASRQGQPHSREMKELGRQMGSLGREMGELHRRRAALQRRLGQDAQASERQSLDKQMEELDRQIQAQEKKMEALGRSMEEVGRKLEEAHRPMEGAGKRMEEASHPMGQLGAQMGALGSQMGEEGRKLDAALRKLAKESLAKGKATALPR
jgi:predicted  nucleic acid-binding Zn-ribbon protein